MTWEKIMKNKADSKDAQEFVDEVIRNAERILDKYTTDYNIDDVEYLEEELRDILRRIFALRSDKKFYGVFTTKKKAEEYLKMVVSDGEAKEKDMVINEVELDSVSSKPSKVGALFDN